MVERLRWLDGAHVDAGLEQMHAKRVAQRMGSDALFQPGQEAGLVAGVPERVAADVASGKHSGEQPLARRPGAPPVVAQGLQQPRREHDEAVLAALALVHADNHAAAVDVGGPQADGLGDAQAGRVAGGQDRAVADDAHRVEEARHLLGAGHDGQLARLLGGGQDLGDVPVALEGDAVEEAQGGDGDADRGGRELLFRGQEQLVVADLLGAQPVRGLAEVAREQRDLADVACLGVRGQVANCHVLRHAGTERGHWEAPLRYRMGCAARGSRPMLPQREPPGKPVTAGWGSVLADGPNDAGETPYRQATSTAERFSPFNMKFAFIPR